MSKYCDTCVFKKSKLKCYNCIAKEELGGEISKPTNYIDATSIESQEAHLKGYIYDSLAFRYQTALERGTEQRALRFLEQGNSKSEAYGKARKENERDLMRFCMILDEAIGEHD